MSFLEYDSESNVITYDESIGDLSDGSVVTFISISNQLDPELPLEDQMQYVPLVVQIEIHGNYKDDYELLHEVTWIYDGSAYGQSPLILGDSIGWLELVSYLMCHRCFYCAFQCLF